MYPMSAADKMMVRMTLCAGHYSYVQDITEFSLLQDIINKVPVFSPGMHPCSCLTVFLKDGVCDGNEHRHYVQGCTGPHKNWAFLRSELDKFKVYTLNSVEKLLSYKVRRMVIFRSEWPVGRC